MLEGAGKVRNKNERLVSTPHLTESERLSVTELKEPVEKIIGKFRKEIEAGEYSVILSDEASGRIPALIIGHVIKEIYERKDFPLPLFRPLAGRSARMGDKDTRLKRITNLRDQFGKIQKTFNDANRKLQKILIVTDTISTGASVGAFSEAIKDNNLKFDVATIGVTGGTSAPELAKRWGTRVEYGMGKSPWIYTSGKKLSGVRKESDSIFPVPRLDVEESKLEDSRKLAKKIAHIIAKKYLNDSLEEQ
jgi:hypothetical protein